MIKYNIYYGIDIGLKHNPTSIDIFCEKNGILYQLHHYFSWDTYIEQINYINLWCEKLGITKGFFDNTRTEWEGFIEMGMIPKELEGIVLTTKTKHQIASELEKMILERKIKLIDDNEMINSILMVQNDLKTIEVAGHHGDAFFSIALAVHAYMKTSTTKDPSPQFLIEKRY